MKQSIVILFLFAFTCSFAQKENKTIRKGNRFYDAAKYEEAEMNYRQSMDVNSRSFPANNNLGNALYRQEKYEEAAKQFLQSSVVDDEKINKADSYYNHGNALMQGDKLLEAIDAYKNALRQNPKDEDARYNLAFAQKQLSQQQQQEGGDQENKEKQDQSEQKQDDKKQEGENKDQEQAQQQEQQEKKKQEQKEGQQAKQEKISKEDAERILNALKNEEQDLQKKLARKKGKRISIEKDW